MATDRREEIGRDITEDADDPRALCTECADPDDGEPIYRGDDWCGGECRCDRCGAALDVALTD